MKKKVLSMMLAGAMTVSMLAGCGAGSDETATTDNTAADTKTETAGTTEAGGGTAEGTNTVCRSSRRKTASRFRRLRYRTLTMRMKYR